MIRIKLRILLKPVVLVMIALFFIASPLVSAQSSNIYQTLEAPFYDPNFSSCGALDLTLPDTIPEPHNTLFSQAASKFRMNPQFLAAIFLSENGNVWKPFNT